VPRIADLVLVQDLVVGVYNAPRAPGILKKLLRASCDPLQALGLDAPLPLGVAFGQQGGEDEVRQEDGMSGLLGEHVITRVHNAVQGFSFTGNNHTIS